MEKAEIKNLKTRYLVWLYKTTKEALDKIERKFTQLDIDKFILKELNKLDRYKKARRFIEDFKLYIQKKERAGLSLKYAGARLNPNYQFLIFKLKAIEKAIVSTLGKSALSRIRSLYEKEMLERILKSTGH